MMKPADQITSYRLWKAFTAATLPAENAAQACANQQQKYTAEWKKVRASLLKGDPLSIAVEKVRIWPEETLAAVRAGEKGNQLPKIFQSLIEMTEEREEMSRGARSKLMLPAVYGLAALSMLYAFLIFVYPSMTSMATGHARDGIIATLDSVNAFANASVWFVIAAVVAGIGLITVGPKIPVINERIQSISNVLPYWGEGQRLTGLGYWAKIFSLLDSTGAIDDMQSIRIATDTLPENQRHSFEKLLSDYRSAGSLARAADRDKWSPREPRKNWPELFVSGISVGSLTGNLGITMDEVSPGLIEEGKVLIGQAVSLASFIGLTIAGACIASIMLVQILSSLSQTMSML